MLTMLTMMITDTGFFSGINCPVSPFFDFGLLSDTSHNAVVGCCSTIIAVVEGVGGRGKGGGAFQEFQSSAGRHRNFNQPPAKKFPCHQPHSIIRPTSNRNRIGKMQQQFWTLTEANHRKASAMNLQPSKWENSNQHCRGNHQFNCNFKAPVNRFTASLPSPAPSMRRLATPS